MDDNGEEITLVSACGVSGRIFVLENVAPPDHDPEGIWSFIYEKQSDDSWEPIFEIQAWLSALAVNSSGNLYAVSLDNQLYSNILNNKQVIDIKSHDGLNSLWISPTGKLFTVGNKGERISASDEKIELVTDLKERCLYSVHGLTDSLVLAVGDQGVIWKYNGVTWLELDQITNDTLYSLYCVSPSEIYVASACGVVYQYDGVDWLELKLPLPMEVFSIAKYNETLYVATGESGVWQYDGSNFVLIKDWIIHELAIVEKMLYGLGGNLIAQFDGKKWEGWDINH